jgi:hypothetical protein
MEFWKKIKDGHKLFILLVIEIVVMFVYIGVGEKHKYVQQAVMLVYLAIFLYGITILWRVYFKGFFGNLKDLLLKIYKYIAKKIKYVIKEAKRILKDKGYGKSRSRFDKVSVEFKIDAFGEFKKMFRSKIRLDLRKADENAEKIRLLYIKLILKSMREGYDYNRTHTPDELYEVLKNKNLEYLMACYKSVRYDRDIHILDEEVKKCENIINGKVI